MLPLDAEYLAEGGIGRRYKSLLRELGGYVSDPAEIEEVIDNTPPRYLVRCRAAEYRIYSPPVDQVDAWGRATHAFFEIVNNQLSESRYRFYAINGGHDLSGTFLTEPEWRTACKSLRRKSDWPYIPTLDAPWFGQLHD